MTDFRICTSCKVHHYENCPQCAGFGLMKRPFEPDFPNGIPIFAFEGMEGPTPEWKPCPHCGSTPAGVPRHL